MRLAVIENAKRFDWDLIAEDYEQILIGA